MSRYTYVPTPLPLKQAVKDGFGKLALMGVPCQTEFIRKLMTTKVKKYYSRVALIIGLLCSETFEFEPFITETMVEKRGIDVNEVRKIIGRKWKSLRREWDRMYGDVNPVFLPTPGSSRSSSKREGTSPPNRSNTCSQMA